MKKLLVATGIYPPDIGGPATYVKTLQDELPNFGYEVKVVTYANNSETANNVFKINRHQNILKKYFEFFKAVYKNIAWADLVYTQGPVSDGLPVFFACKLKKKKYILKIVGDHAWEQGKQRFGVTEMLDEFQNKKYSCKVEIIRFAQRLVARQAVKVITPSHYLKKIVSQWGVDENKIEVVYNSVEEVILEENRDSLRQQFGFSGDIICSVGRLVKWKGFDVLIEAMVDLIKVNHDFKLLIFGDGPEKKYLQEIIDKLQLADSVKLMGSQPQVKLWQYMGASDMFILNTGYEGLPHIIIEAMQLKLPVVATNRGGNTEVIEDGVNGLLIEYNDKEKIKEAVIELSKNKDKKNKLIENGAVVARRFNREQMIAGVIKVLDQIN